MKKVFLYHWLTTITLYTIVYLVRTFIIWEFNNPFAWIINMPNYDNETRGLGLFAIAMWQGFQLLIVSGVVRELNKNNHDKNSIT